MKRIVLDIEANNLLQTGLDYSKLPYRLKDDFNVWCVVCRDVDTGEVATFVGEVEIKSKLKPYLQKVTEVIGHNISMYDLPVLKLWMGLEYHIGYVGETSTLYGNPVIFWDTLVLSYLLYSDTVVGHSLGAWGLRFGNPKIDFHDFSKYSEEMLTYCIQDTSANLTLFKKQMEEYTNYNWATAYALENKLADITLSQELYGFKFNKDLAEKCVAELTERMAGIAANVDPILPEKPLNKGEIKPYIPPKIQFKKCGGISAIMEKWLEKHSGKFLSERKVELYGVTYDLPLPEYPIVSTGKATVDDGEHIKWYLLSMNWTPSQYKERDLTVDQKKKKRTKEDFWKTVDRYVEQTLTGPFKEWRLKLLDVREEELRGWLLSKDSAKPIRVPTAPTLTVGVEKEICPNLLAMADKFPFAKDVVEYYTYKHRKNSIAGGLDEDGEPTSGFLVQMRDDGRIPTPANTNGTNTGRYTHRGVCNIARVSSLYGHEMRSLFGVDRSANQVQLGFDFSSLEALCNAHFVLKRKKDGELIYKYGDDLAKTLVSEKPNDIHSVNARKMGIDRSTAKTLGYSLMYGAQAAKISKSMSIPMPRAKQLFEDYWTAVPALKQLKDALQQHWESNHKKFVQGIDGRKVYTRSAHSCINAIFQNCGSLAAKYTLVYIHQELERLDLWGNVFDRDLHGKPSIQQMIAYHDEAQFSIHKSLVSFKVFKSEDEAKAVVTKDSSTVGHIGENYFVAFSPMSQIIKDAITCTEKLLKLNVNLGFEWACGSTWSECH